MRLGNTASAPFLGTQFASLYRGAVRVPTVPGKPAISFVLPGSPISAVQHLPLSQTGGSPITSFLYFIDGVQTAPSNSGTFGPFVNASFAQNLSGKAVRFAAVNAIGEGPMSNPVTGT